MIKILPVYSELEPIVCLSAAISPQDIAEIVRIGDNQEFQNAKVGSNQDGVENDRVRDSKITWLHHTEQTDWLFNKMAEITSTVNSDKYQFELSHIDAFQYTTYTENGFYGWHVDADFKKTFGPNQRKLGFSLILNEQGVDFEGGDFQVIPGGNPKSVLTMHAKPGDILAFPSFIPHQVDKVTKGKRKSLVWWVQGPKFK
jgi:PKHD-type hydroxylase